MALDEVNWARIVQAPMPQTNEPNLLENQIIDACKEERCAISIPEIAARKNGRIKHLTSVPAPLMKVVPIRESPINSWKAVSIAYL
jgi:hypothetical protein